ncbi:ABC transporter permease [Ruminococcaceae bacterium OttesenSCG-928-D13]|nr:ABC transporter permease [Ruminococcaceae bacterium OttesenSCG-928-D13]
MELSTLISSMLRLGTPLLLAALGVLVSAKGGIVNMGMEGNMLFGAFMSVYVTYLTGQPMLGLLASIPAGIIYSLILGAFIIKGRGHQVVCGLGLNFVVIGCTTVLLSVVWNSSGYSTDVPRLPQVKLPFLGQQSISLFITAVLVVAVWFFLEKTNTGLRVRSVGENPAAADSVGVDVVKYQFLAMVIAGALGGLAGAELAVGQMGYFIKQMTASKGFLAYSAVIFAGYNPYAVVLTTMFIGLLDAVQMRAQTMLNIPGQFLLMLPYLVTLLALIFVGDKKKPKAAGKTYVRGSF